MKSYALRSYAHGGQWGWLDGEVPHPGPGEVLVKVGAAGINPLDRMIAEGQFKRLITYSLPQAMGQELAGTVEGVGEGVASDWVGKRIFARTSIYSLGAFAEYAVIGVEDIAPMPDNLTFAEAASLPLVLLTAIQALTEKVRIKPGDKVFIQGGAGGAGSIAVQVAKHLGATVATTVSSRNVELAGDLGADVVVDYKTQRYEDYVKDYDVVLDTLGQGETMRSMGVLRPGGTIVSLAGAPDTDFARQLHKPFLVPVMWALGARVRREAKKRGVHYKFLFMRAHGGQLADYVPAVESGEIRPVVGRVLPFSRVGEALGLLVSGEVRAGKIVVSMG